MAPTFAVVRLHGTEVGALYYDRGGTWFEYNDDLLSHDHRVLGQVFEDDPHTVRSAKTGLPAWFANLLPEGELRHQIIREMGGGNVSDYRLLLRLGSDLPGAVTVEADQEPDDSADAPAAEPAADHALRYSLAGMQLKYSIHSSRLTAPVSGEDSWWVAKLPDRTLTKLAENEYFTMRWLATAGFDVPRVQLAPATSVGGLPADALGDDDLVYLVERFDRIPGGRVHSEDFAQLANVWPHQKYGEFGATYSTMGAVILHLTGNGGFEAFLSRLVAAVIVGNVDAHLKNWAIYYPDGRTPTLAPVYDFHSLTVYQRFRYTPLALALPGERMPSRVDPSHLADLAREAGASPSLAAETVAATVSRLRQAWSGDLLAQAHEWYPTLAAHYESRLHGLPLARAT